LVYQERIHSQRTNGGETGNPQGNTGSGPLLPMPPIKKEITLKYAILLLFIISSVYGRFGSENETVSKPQIIKTVVYLKNGSMISNDSALLVMKNSRLNYINIQNRLFSADETDSISVNNKLGISYNNKWIFRIMNGNISLYTDKLNQNTNRIKFISKGDTIYEYSLSTLNTMVKNDHKSFDLVERRIAAEIGGNSFIALGVIVVAYHLIGGTFRIQSEKGLQVSPLLFGLGLALAIPVYLTRNNEIKAIINYNSNYK
jgi:hypothetical protein